MTRTSKLARVALAAAWALTVLALPAQAASRIKDLANVEGVRQNQLIGYGLVVGLNGTGDTLNNIPFTKQSLQAMLERLGVNVRGAQMRTGNVAAVMVTANLPAFATQGTRMDVTVSALGTAAVQGHFGGHALVLVTDAGDRLVMPDQPPPGFDPSVADWTFRQGQPAGLATSTLAAQHWHYVPLRRRRGCVASPGSRRVRTVAAG